MKKFMVAIAMAAVSTTAVIGLCSFTNQVEPETEGTYPIVANVESRIAATGGKCGHGISCRCTGFRPKSTVGSGSLYCNNCGHHKNYHH